MMRMRMQAGKGFAHFSLRALKWIGHGGAGEHPGFDLWRDLMKELQAWYKASKLSSQ